MSSDSDNSNDEYIQRLKEAVDPDFIGDAIFKKHPTSSKPAFTKELDLPSLRHKGSEDDKFTSNGLTPQVQQYVAKHLTKLLDEHLEKRFSMNNDDKIMPKRKRKSSIKLFKESCTFVKARDKTKQFQPLQSTRRVASKKTCSDEGLTSKCASVAVTVDDLVNETKSWSNRTKAPVYIYRKSKDSTELTLIEPPFR